MAKEVDVSVVSTRRDPSPVAGDEEDDRLVNTHEHTQTHAITLDK